MRSAEKPINVIQTSKIQEALTHLTREGFSLRLDSTKIRLTNQKSTDKFVTSTSLVTNQHLSENYQRIEVPHK